MGPTETIIDPILYSLFSIIAVLTPPFYAHHCHGHTLPSSPQHQPPPPLSRTAGTGECADNLDKCGEGQYCFDQDDVDDWECRCSDLAPSCGMCSATFGCLSFAPHGAVLIRVHKGGGMHLEVVQCPCASHQISEHVKHLWTTS